MESSHVGHVEECNKTTRLLFAEAYVEVPFLSEEPPTERKPFPTLSEDEATSSLIYLSIHLSTHLDALQTGNDWRQPLRESFSPLSELSKRSFYD